MALGIGLTITNSKGVIEALLGKQSAFARTPKYSVQTKGAEELGGEGGQEIPQAAGNHSVDRDWRWAPASRLMVWYAITNENYVTVPFLILFVYGYWYTGLMSLLQGRFDFFRQHDASNEEEHIKPFPVGV